MKLSDFILLDEEKKTFTVLHQGVLVAKRREPFCMVFLFQLAGYYVETWCNTESKKVQEFRVFDNTQLLQPWLEAIPIQDLLR
jgi:hypothetical protein